MTYGLILDPDTVKFLEGLSKELRQRIFGRMRAAKEDPIHFFERLEGRKDYKMRIGDYRVIADADHGLKRIEVTLIDHRKKVYKKLEKR